MTTLQVRVIRVFVSSPGDLGSARDCVDEVLERINRDPAVAAQVRLEAWKWETDAAPYMGPTAQEAIDWQTPPFEIYLGLMSARFGHATDKFGSGTEQEFQQALQRWQETGRPRILFYFDENAKPGTSPDDARQWLSVCEFRTKLHGLGLFYTYRGVRRGKNSLVPKLDQHLRQVVHDLLRAPPCPAPPQTADNTPAVPAAYRRWLQSECGEMQLLGLRPKQAHALRLNHVYVPLTTRPEAGRKVTSPEAEEDLQQRMLGRGREERPQLLLDLLDQKSLYVSGDAGTGKSTFCRWAGYLACAGQMPDHAVPPPENYQERFPESLRSRLPVLVRLREFWQHLPTKPNCRELTQAELEASLGRWLRATRPGELTWDDVAAHLALGTALLILDGVDEIPLAHGGDDQECWPRQMLLAGLAAAAPDWHAQGNRVLLTSRPYGLADREAETLGLAAAHIDPLDEQLQQLLACRWFQLLSDRPESAEAGAAEAAAMLRDARGREGLDQLVTNPMLLTATCVVYNEGKRLPQDKYDLYARIVENVLYNRYNDPTRIERVHGHLAAIAYAMHTGKWLGEPRSQPRAATDYEELRRILTAYREQNPGTDHGVADVVDTRERLLSRTGLLLPRGDRQAAFYHLSIQEFLAAQRLVLIECDSEGALLGALLTHGAEAAWRNTLSFAFGCYLDKYKLSSQKGIRLVERIVEHVCSAAFRRSEPAEAATTSGELAEAGTTSVAEHQHLLVVAADGLEMLLGKKLQLPAPLQERYRQIGLAAIAQEIPAKPRWTLTTVLGRLGDERIANDLRIGPRPEEHPGYVRIPAGKYFYGEDKEPITIDEPFLLSRYPVTNSQYAVFLENGGYTERRWWSDEGWQWLQQEKVSEPRFWRDAKWNAPNQPVVGISFWEAEALAKWAGGRLPTEREWEAAARGPQGYEYPWGDKWEDGICNSDEAGLGATSPVGMFPRSKSNPFGLEDMAGNVWEWCVDFYDPKKLPGVRVLRGGCWDYDSRVCRAAFRSWNYPVFRNSSLVVVVCCVFARQDSHRSVLAALLLYHLTTLPLFLFSSSHAPRSGARKIFCRGGGQAYRIQFWPMLSPAHWNDLARPKLNSVSLTPT